MYIPSRDPSLQKPIADSPKNPLPLPSRNFFRISQKSIIILRNLSHCGSLKPACGMSKIIYWLHKLACKSPKKSKKSIAKKSLRVVKNDLRFIITNPQKRNNWSIDRWGGGNLHFFNPPHLSKSFTRDFLHPYVWELSFIRHSANFGMCAQCTIFLVFFFPKFESNLEVSTSNEQHLQGKYIDANATNATINSNFD